MPISLKHIDYINSDGIKLDKVNYNFDQLVWNGGGPRGAQGHIGQEGPQGTTGIQGYKGPTGTEGFQGTPGPVSENYWIKTNRQESPNYIDADTLIPKHTPENQFAPVVVIGHTETDPEYGTKSDLVGGKTPYQWKIHRKQYSPSNLRFLNSIINSNAFDFKLEFAGGKDQMTFGFLNMEDSISVYKSAMSSFRSGISATDNLYVADSGTYFKIPTTFNSPVVIKNGLIIEGASADTNKIAISADSTGKVIFKSVQELGGTVPFGTIVSILPTIFADNNKFVNTESITQGDTSPVYISVGRGIGNYKGWYLCNGQKWTNGNIPNPANGYFVPMLGNFNYSIDDNPHSTSPLGQGVAVSSNIRNHITGGSNIDITATSVPNLVYNVTSTVNTSTVQVDPGSGSTFRIKQLPQIIYLGYDDLYWFDAGQNQNPPINLTLMLGDENTTASKLSPNPYTLKVITDQAAHASYTFNSTITAPSGYYWSTVPTAGAFTMIPSYATITNVTLGSETYPASINVTFSISDHPTTETTATLNINTASFISQAAVNIVLTRLGDPGNTVATTPQINTISYSFVTGYTFTLVLNTISGYRFTDNIAYIYSAIGGATYTVNSSVLNSGNTQLTLNITISNVAAGVADLSYSLGLNTASTIPRIVSGPSSGFSASNGTGFVNQTTRIENNTGATVYIWVGVNQFYTGSGTTASITAQYVSQIDSPFFWITASANTTAGQYFSPTYITLTNTTDTGFSSSFSRNATTDSAHTVQLYWSNSPTGIKQILTY